MSATIDIYGAISRLSGDFPFTEVRQATSWYVSGAEYSKAFKKGAWDGRKHLLHAKTGTFPTGLLNTVVKVLQSTKTAYNIIDHREEPKLSKDATFELKGISFDYPYDYQLDTAKKMVAQKQGLVRIATNGGKTELACAVTNYLRLNTLFIVTSRELLYQAQKRFATRLGVPINSIGIIGDGNWIEGDWVTIAILDTLEARASTAECQRLLNNTEVLFIDEVHHTGSETWFDTITCCDAYYRFGLSGTPLDRTDGANLRIIAATGDIIVDIPNKFLVERGVSAKAHIVFDKITEPVLPPKTPYTTAYSEGVIDNDNLNNRVIEWASLCRKAGLSTLILVDSIKQGRILDELLWTNTNGEFIPHQFIYGDEDTETRKNALEDFSNRVLPVLIASSILNEGVDVPTIDVIILAGARKSKISTLQRLGRGLRGAKLIIIEFSNFCNDYLLRHSLKRYNDYKNEECFPMYSSSPSLELLQKLWNSS